MEMPTTQRLVTTLVRSNSRPLIHGKQRQNKYLMTVSVDSDRNNPSLTCEFIGLVWHILSSHMSVVRMCHSGQTKTTLSGNKLPTADWLKWNQMAAHSGSYCICSHIEEQLTFSLLSPPNWAVSLQTETLKSAFGLGPTGDTSKHFLCPLWRRQYFFSPRDPTPARWWQWKAVFSPSVAGQLPATGVLPSCLPLPTVCSESTECHHV